MAVNQASIAVLRATTVPPDLLCHLPQETADAIAATVVVEGLASQVQGASGVTSPVTNNVGQQALDLAQQNQIDIVALQGKTIQRRLVALRQNVVAGDSIQSYGISPAMPSADYIVILNFSGPNTHPSAYYGWRFVTGTPTTNSFQISYDNIPSSTVVTIMVEEARNIE